jgi:hypothetical protein
LENILRCIKILPKEELLIELLLFLLYLAQLYLYLREKKRKRERANACSFVQMICHRIHIALRCFIVLSQCFVFCLLIKWPKFCFHKSTPNPRNISRCIFLDLTVPLIFFFISYFLNFFLYIEYVGDQSSRSFSNENLNNLNFQRVVNENRYCGYSRRKISDIDERHEKSTVLHLHFVHFLGRIHTYGDRKDISISRDNLPNKDGSNVRFICVWVT